MSFVLGKVYWKGTKKEIDPKKPIYQDESALMYKFMNAWARSKFHELHLLTKGQAMDRGRKEWKLIKDNTASVNNFLAKFGEDFVKVKKQRTVASFFGKVKEGTSYKEAAASFHVKSIKSEPEEHESSNISMMPCCKEDSILIQVCKILGVTPLPALDLDGICSKAKLKIVQSSFAKATAFKTFLELKNEYYHFKEKRKTKTSLRQKTNKVSSLLWSIKRELQSCVQDINHLCAGFQKTAQGFKVSIENIPKVSSLADRLFNLGKLIGHVVDKYLLVPSKGLHIALRRRIGQLKERESMEGMVPKSKERELIFFARTSVNKSWDSAISVVEETKLSELRYFTPTELLHYCSIISVYSGMKIDDFAQRFKNPRSLHAALREICRYLPVVAFWRDGAGVLVDAENVETVGNIVWAFMFQPKDCSESTMEEGGSDCGMLLEETNTDESPTGVKDTESCDSEIRAAVVACLSSAVSTVCDLLGESDEDDIGAEPDYQEQEGKEEEENGEYVKPGPVPFYKKFPEIIPLSEEFLEKNGHLRAQDRRRDDSVTTDNISNGTAAKNLKEHLEKNIKGLKLSVNAVRYLFLPPNRSTREGKRYKGVLKVKAGTNNNSSRKSNKNDYHAKVTVKFIRDMSRHWWKIVDHFSNDAKAKINCNGKPAVSRHHRLRRRYFKTDQMPQFDDHDFPVRGYLIVPSGILKIWYEEVTNPTTGETKLKEKSKLHVINRALKFNKSGAVENANDLWPHLVATHKPIVTIISDNGPDWSTMSWKVLLAIGRAWKDSKKDVLILAMFAPGMSAFNKIERKWAFLSFLIAGVILSATLPGEEVPPSNQAKLSEDELRKKEMLLFILAMRILCDYWHGKELDGEKIVSTFIPCGEKEEPYSDSDIIEEFLNLAPTKMQNAAKFGLSKEMIELADIFKFVVTHMIRRPHLLILMKCEREGCDHCSTNPISKEAQDSIYALMKKHNGFYEVIDDPERPGHKMRFESVLNAKENLDFKRNGQKCPKQSELEEQRWEQFKIDKLKDPKTKEPYPYECPLCLVSNIGSPFRRYTFLSKKDAQRHRIIFHSDNKKRVAVTKLGKKRGRPVGSKTKVRNRLPNKKARLSNKIALMAKSEKENLLEISDDASDDVDSDFDIKEEEILLSSEDDTSSSDSDSGSDDDSGTSKLPEILEAINIPKPVMDEVGAIFRIFKDVKDPEAPVTWANGQCLRKRELDRLLAQGGRAAWLNDNIIDMFRELVNAHSKDTKCWVFSPHLFPLVERDLKFGNDVSTVRWIIKDLQKGGLVSLEGLANKFRFMLFPLRLKTVEHWVLGVIDIENVQAFVVNPFHTETTGIEDKKLVEDLVIFMKRIKKPLNLHLGKVNFSFPEENTYPLTQQMDGFNCGVYVCLYILHFVFNEFVEPPVDPRQMRVWMVYWLLKSEVPNDALVRALQK